MRTQLLLWQVPPVDDNGVDAPCVSDVFKRIGFEQHKVGAPVTSITVTFIKASGLGNNFLFSLAKYWNGR